VEQVVAYSALAATVGLAVARPHFTPTWRITPGIAALIGLAALLATHLMTPAAILACAHVQWRPLVTVASIMVVSGVVREVGAFERLATALARWANGRSAASTFALVFVLAAAVPALLNNDAAILILTPLVVVLARRLYPDRPALAVVFAFAVFLAPGVAPLIVSNPMNMIVATFAGLDFNSYAVVMVPVSLAGVATTYLVLRLVFRRELAGVRADVSLAPMPPARRGERPAIALMVGVFCAYPIAAAYGVELWAVAAVAAMVALAIARAWRIAPARRVVSHISIDTLVFLWGMFLVVQALRGIGIVEHLQAMYSHGPQIPKIGITSAVGAAVIDNHPMALLDMLALDTSHGARPLLAALVGADLGPRLLPIGSLAGLLWIELLRRERIHVGIGTFVRVGTLALVPTLAVSLGMLWLVG
jgi:arsenical pump membrane protein